MYDVLVATAVSFGVIFVAELGDKSQLMALTFATRFTMVPVLVGITIATSVVHLVSVAVGHGLGAAVPTGWIALVLAVVGIVLGIRYRRRAASSRPMLGAPWRFGSPSWWVRALSAVAAVVGLAAPLLVAVDVIQPLSLFSDPGIAVAGAGVFLGGFALWRAAMASLVASGRATEGRPGFATMGLHARTRNPGLTGVVVATAGLLLMVPTVMGVLAMVLIVVAVQIQARAVREPRLAAAYGAAYAGYVLRSGRFLPRLRPAEAPGLRDRVRVG